MLFPIRRGEQRFVTPLVTGTETEPHGSSVSIIFYSFRKPRAHLAAGGLFAFCGPRRATHHAPRDHVNTRDVIHSTQSREARGGQMPKFKHYSPQLSKELVCQLYHRAKAERVPMTVLANQLIEEALGNKKRINTRRVAETQNIPEPN